MSIYALRTIPLAGLVCALLLLASVPTSLAQAPSCPTVIDFETDADGNALSAGTVVDNEYAAFGITVTTQDPVDHPAMIFDTANPTGGDTDLQTPGYGPGNTEPLGHVLIISEDGDPSNPDDDADGGTLIFTFDQDATITSVDILDIDENEGGTITAFDGGGGVIASAPIADLGDNSFQQIALDAAGVRRLEVFFTSSGALTGLNFDCEDVCVDLDLSIEPIGSVVIPPDGGTITFEVTVTNQSSEVQILEARLVEHYPDGTVLDPARGPVTVTLEPGQTGSRTISVRIPSSMPDGEYFCEVVFSNGCRAGFFWTKLPGRMAGASSQDVTGTPYALDYRFADTDSAVGSSAWFHLSETYAGSTHASAARTEARGDLGLSGYPNPFNPQTTLRFEMAEAGAARLIVYDVMGREVARLVDGTVDAGLHEATFRGDALPSGTYLVRLEADGQVQTQRLTLLK